MQLGLLTISFEGMAGGFGVFIALCCSIYNFFFTIVQNSNSVCSEGETTEMQKMWPHFFRVNSLKRTEATVLMVTPASTKKLQ